MNTSQKCNCCGKEDVCKYKEQYENAVDKILNCNVADNCNVPHSNLMSIEKLEYATFIEVSIKCPFRIEKNTSNIRSVKENKLND